MKQMSKEYAVALFALATEENCRKEVMDSLNVMVGILEENREYIDLLSSPAVPKDERLTMIDGAFSALNEYATSFLKLLCERRLVHEFFACVEEYSQLLADSSNVSVAKVTGAVELTPEEETKLKEKLEAMCKHTVVMETDVDATLLGGMIIEIDGKVIDASLRRRLSDVKDVISR